MIVLGTTHKVDKFGRLVLPKETRKFYHIEKDDVVEIVPTSGGILIRKPGYEMVRSEESNEYDVL